MANHYLQNYNLANYTLKYFDSVQEICFDSNDSYKLKFMKQGTLVTIPDSGGDAFLKTSTITAASISASTRVSQTSVVLTPATTFSAGTNSLAAIRGDITLSAGKTITDGFFYGVQGKFVGTTGTFNQSSAGRITGVIGQVDLGTMTITSGQVSAVWADLQGGPTNNGGETFVLRVTNSMSVNADSMAFYHGKAATFMTVAEPSPSFISTPGGFTPSGGTSKLLKCVVGGETVYILAAAVWS